MNCFKRRRSPVDMDAQLTKEEDKDIAECSRDTEKGLKQMVRNKIRSNRTSKHRETVYRTASVESCKTENEIMCRKAGTVDRLRGSRYTAGVDGPNPVFHLPDVVVHSDHRRPLPFQITNQAVLLFLNISGLTALCETYSQAAKSGIEQLTETMNSYISALVSEIISYDGDILKFTEYGILSMWSVYSFPLVTPTIESVIQCALDVQRKYGTHTTSDGVTLKLKIGIAAGEVQILIIGNAHERRYVETGRGIEDVIKAMNACENGGDVVLAPSAWIHCYNHFNADHVVIHGTKFVNVTRLNPRSSLGYRTTAATRCTKNPDLSFRNLTAPSTTILDQAGSKMMVSSSKESPQEGDGRQRHTCGLQNTIVTHFNRLKLFISKPILQRIEDGQPLEYLSEMRPVTMLFVRFVVDRDVTKYGYRLLMQRCYEVIYTKAKRTGGRISKIFAFDEGCPVFMVTFGLPGYEHKNDSADALDCAYEIYTELNEIVRLKQTSVAVTTGTTYCGIVGHNQRHEYTVIGRPVSMGPRLMKFYRGKVICDDTTFCNSKLNETYFIAQEPKEISGRQVETVREYRPPINTND